MAALLARLVTPLFVYVAIALLALLGVGVGIEQYRVVAAQRAEAKATADAAATKAAMAQQVADAQTLAHKTVDAYRRREDQFSQSLLDQANDYQKALQKDSVDDTKRDADLRRLRASLAAYASAARNRQPAEGNSTACSGDDPRVATIAGLLDSGAGVVRQGQLAVRQLSEALTLVQGYAAACHTLTSSETQSAAPDPSSAPRP